MTGLVPCANPRCTAKVDPTSKTGPLCFDCRKFWKPDDIDEERKILQSK